MGKIESLAKWAQKYIQEKDRLIAKLEADLAERVKLDSVLDDPFGPHISIGPFTGNQNDAPRVPIDYSVQFRLPDGGRISIDAKKDQDLGHVLDIRTSRGQMIVRPMSGNHILVKGSEHV